MFDLTNPIYSDAAKARAYLEGIQWPNGPVCPHCGNVDQGTIGKIEGTKKSHRDGLYYCGACRDQFTVTVGTVMERSHIPLNKWVLAAHLMAASKKGVSGHQLMRTLGVTYKTAWFLAHRLREAMKGDLDAGPLGGSGKTVEADETYIGRKDDQSKSQNYRVRKPGNIKRTVVSLVERGGNVRSFHVETATVASVSEILKTNVDPATTLYTDESRLYTKPGAGFAEHSTVHHSSGEYARFEGEKVIHTNTIENVFSVFKRGMVGVYQHCGEAHLHRYLAEFDFRYNRRSALGVEDQQRTEDLLRGAVGKRLTYRRIGLASIA
jgi:transposase-like protein